MSQMQVLVDVAAVMTTLEQFGGATSPKSAIYLAMDCDHARYLRVEMILVEAGWAKVTPETIALTKAGMAKTKAINAAIEKDRLRKTG